MTIRQGNSKPACTKCHRPTLPCGRRCLAVLQEFYGGDNLYTSYVYPPLGVMRRWDSFSQIVTEVENARVWGGVHYLTSVEHGTRIGRQVAEFALKTPDAAEDELDTVREVPRHRGLLSRLLFWLNGQLQDSIDPMAPLAQELEH